MLDIGICRLENGIGAFKHSMYESVISLPVHKLSANSLIISPLETYDISRYRKKGVFIFGTFR